jgi:hypothetical protein
VTSKTETDEPRRVIPKTAKEQPKRANDLRDNDEPMETTSKTDKLDPRRATPNTENEEPRRATDLRDKLAPK